MSLHFRRRRKLFANVIRKRRPKGPIPFHQALFLSFLIFIVMTFLSLIIVNRSIKPIIMDIANLETQKIAVSTINYSINNVIENIDMDEFIVINENEHGEIVSVGFNPHIYNKVQVEVITNAQKYLTALETGNTSILNEPEKIVGLESIEDGIIHYIPLGAVTKNAFFAQHGPKIPVKFTTIGEIAVDLNEEIKRVGINNTWIRVSIDLKVQVEVIIPFATDITVITTTLPIGFMLVPGEVPYFYGAGEGNFPSPAFIVEDETEEEENH